MQVAAQPAALLLARGDQLLARALQVGVQPHGLHRGAGLAREQSSSRRRSAGEQLLAGPARRQHEAADRLALGDERDLERRTARRSDVRSGREPGRRRELDGRVREPQRARHGIDERREHGVGPERRLEPMAELGDRARRLVACAVQEPVDAALEAIAQGRRGQRAHRGRRGGDEPPLARPDRADAEHERGVGAHDARAQRAVDERAVEDELDVVQPVADDRDPGQGGAARSRSRR